MKQKILIDIRLYDDNMRTIYNKNKISAEKGIIEVAKIVQTKIKGR